MTGPTDLDSASAAPLHPAAREVLLAALDRGYADPRRLHRHGREARLLLDNARAATADALGVRADEVTFTPSGTHAVHLGLLGLVRGSRRGDGVVHSAVEHSAVRHAVAWGARAAEVSVMGDGRVYDGDLVEGARSPGVGVVALQTANHEVGTVQPVGGVRAPQRHPTVLRCLCLHGPAAPATGLGERRGVRTQVGWTGGRRRAAGAQASTVAQPVPRRRPRRRALDRLREHPRRARSRRFAAGRGGRAQRGQRAAPRARRRRTPSGGAPRCPTSRWSATPTGDSPTW